MLVTHDRHLLNRLTTVVLELDRGHAYFHDGGYELYLAARAERKLRPRQLSPLGATWPAGNLLGCAGAPRRGPVSRTPTSRRPCA